MLQNHKIMFLKAAQKQQVIGSDCCQNIINSVTKFLCSHFNELFTRKKILISKGKNWEIIEPQANRTLEHQALQNIITQNGSKTKKKNITGTSKT